MKSRSKGFGIYAIVMVVLLVILYLSTGLTRNTKNYTYTDVLKDLAEGKVETLTIIQNKEVPTGKLQVRLEDETKIVYISDVTKVVEDTKEYENTTEIILTDVRRESVFLTSICQLFLWQYSFLYSFHDGC